jgi:protein-disulfide isomerase
VSLSVFIVSFLGLKDSSTQSIFHRFSEVFMKTFIKNFINYTIIVLGFFACGMGIGQISQSGNTKITDNDPFKLEIESAIKAYKSADSIDIDLKNVPMLGDENAKITIVKFADFNCGHCMYASHTLRTILAEFTGLVKVYYKNFPLDGNCNPAVQRKTTHGSSCVAAAAALCGNEQAKFYEVYTGLYNDTEKGLMHTPATVLEIAKRSGLNIDKFNTCMASSKVRDQIYAESVEGDQKLKIQSTPSLYINNKPIAPGNPNIEFLRALIKDLINENP